MSETETVTEPTSEVREPIDGIFDSSGDTIDFTPVANGAAENNGDLPTTNEQTAFNMDPDAQSEEVKAEAPEAQPTEEAPSKEAKPPRMIKVGDTELPADQLVNANGIEVPIGDIVNSYIGQAEVQRRFTEFDKHKKQWERDVVKRFEESEALTSTKLKKINELSKKGDHFGVLSVIAQFAGKDPIEFEQQMVNQALELADKFTEMSDDEVKAHWAEKRAVAAKRELERREAKDQEQLTAKEREQAITTQIAKMGLSQAQFSEAYNILKQDEQTMAALKDLSPEEATARVCNFYLDSAKEYRCEEVVKRLAPEHPEHENFVDILYKVAEHSDSVEDIEKKASKYLNIGSHNASEAPSKELAPKQQAPADKPEKTNSSAIRDLANLEPEDALGWDL